MNRLVVVSGGTRGIGRAIIERFAVAGFDIATCARTAADLQSMQTALEKKNPTRVFVLPADLTITAEAKRFADFVNELNRPVDILVNNAGYFIPGSIIAEEEGNLEEMIQANVLSAYHLTRGLVKGMIERKGGHIFTMCSIASMKAYPNGGSYTITKFALLGFSKVLREELKEHGIRVTALLAGATKTDSWAGVDLPDSRFMKVEDIADLVFATYSLSGNSVVEEILIRPQLGDIGPMD